MRCTGASRVPGGLGGQAQQPCIIHGCNELLIVSSDRNVYLPRHAADGPPFLSLLPSSPLSPLSRLSPLSLLPSSLSLPPPHSLPSLCFTFSPSLPHSLPTSLCLSTSLPLYLAFLPVSLSPSLPLPHFLSPTSSLRFYLLPPYSFIHHLLHHPSTYLCTPTSVPSPINPVNNLCIPPTHPSIN